MSFKSLAVYISQAKIQRISREECLEHAFDYGVFLARYDTELFRKQAKHYGNVECLPLSQIALSPKDYCYIVKQVYSGRMPLAIEKPSDFQTQDAIEAIMERINMLQAAREEGQKRVSGLVVGRVQSGKTSNYIELLLKAVSEGWNIVIVLTSNNTALGRQTYLRVKGRIANSRDAGNKAKCLNCMKEDGNISFDPTISFDGIANGNFYWGIVLKETNHLDNVLNWIGNNRNYVKKMSILVIDDEADNASVDAIPQRQLLSEDAVQAFIEEIPNENQLLKEWLSSLLNLELSNSQHDTLDKCMSRGNAGEKMDRLLGNPDVISMLSLNDYVNEDGEPCDIKPVINDYFNDKRNHGRERTKATFILLLRSIFNIVQASSTINRQIRQLISMRDGADDYEYDFKRCAYIGYTATPYACIFNRPANETPLYPNFIYSLDKSQGYFGLDEIFGSDMSHAEPRMPIVTVITSDDNNILQKIEDAEQCEDFNALDVKEDTLYLSYNSLHYALNDESYGERSCEQLKNAIAWAFCCAAVRRFYRRSSKQQDGSREACFTTMLINLSARQNYHKKLQAIISTYINYQCGNGQQDMFREECKAAWMTQTTKLTSEHFKELFGYEANDYPSWEDIQDDLTWFFDKSHCMAIQINSTSEGKEGQRLYEDGGETEEAQSSRQDTLWFICGGNTISRGLTLAGLCVSFFDRVNRLTAVDTYIQMGRWFGYRRGYELLPRIWMPFETVKEYKRASYVENNLHIKLREAFDTQQSPEDSQDFLIVYYWGRKLSNRAFAMKILSQKLGTKFATDEISILPDNVKNIAESVKIFLERLDNAQYRFDNREAFEDYSRFSVWSNIASSCIKDFLINLLQFYPRESQQVLNGVIHEIEKENGDFPWHVVLGSQYETQKTSATPFNIWSSYWTGAGTPVPSVYDGIAHYSNAASVVAYYSMVDKRFLNAVDANVLERNKFRILANLRDKESSIDLVKNMPAGSTVEEQFDKYIDYLKQNTEVAMSHVMRGLMKSTEGLSGYSNRSRLDYQNEVYNTAGITQPVLQIYPIIAPPESGLPKDTLLFSISFFWPNHQSDDFLRVAVGDNTERRITFPEFTQSVKKIIEEFNSVISRRKLWEKISMELEGRCSKNYFDNHINKSTQAYKQFPGRNGYYLESWAANQEIAIERFESQMKFSAYNVLMSHPNKLFSTKKLLDTISMDEKLDSLLRTTGSNNDCVYLEHILDQAFCQRYGIRIVLRSHKKHFIFEEY